MILLTHNTPILLGVAPADFRRGIDGFIALCEQELSENPRSGTIHVFINRARTMIRALAYDGTGYWLITKRLSKGRFSGWPITGGAVSPVTARELRQLLGGHWSPELASAERSTTVIASARES